MKRIQKLKRIAKKNFLEYHSLLDNFSCGAHLAETISLRVSTAKINFNEAMDELQKIDPLVPLYRL